MLFMHCLKFAIYFHGFSQLIRVGFPSMNTLAVLIPECNILFQDLEEVMKYITSTAALKRCQLQ
jgi:hypothetical protein